MSFEKKLQKFINYLISEHNDSEGVGFMKNEYIDDVVSFIGKNNVSMEELIELTASNENLVSFYAEVAYDILNKNKNLSAIQIEINKLESLELAVVLAETYHKKAVKEWISDNRYSEVGEMSVQNLLFITSVKILGM